jgi:hypothetical protein
MPKLGRRPRPDPARRREATMRQLFYRSATRTQQREQVLAEAAARQRLEYEEAVERITAVRMTAEPRRSPAALIGRVALVVFGAAWVLLPMALMMLVR